eukprot:938626_1
MSHSVQRWKRINSSTGYGILACASLGHKTAMVMACGGESKVGYVFKITNPAAKMELVGHQTSMSSVQFDPNESLLAGGSEGGSVRVWDLDGHGKLVRSMKGHRTAVTCIDFHPFGQYYASGSLDTTVKLWDMKRRDQLFSYKGHRAHITAVCHSPDGRWLASGDASGVFRITDISAGKLVFEHCSVSRAEVTAFAFSPEELVMAVAVGKRIDLWDLESWNIIASTDLSTSQTECLKFFDGWHFLAASRDHLKVWEISSTVQLQDTIDIPWNGIADIALGPTDVLHGIPVNGPNLDAFAVDLKNVAPFGNLPAIEISDKPKVTVQYSTKVSMSGARQMNPNTGSPTRSSPLRRAVSASKCISPAHPARVRSRPGSEHTRARSRASPRQFSENANIVENQKNLEARQDDEKYPSRTKHRSEVLKKIYGPDNLPPRPIKQPIVSKSGLKASPRQRGTEMENIQVKSGSPVQSPDHCGPLESVSTKQVAYEPKPQPKSEVQPIPAESELIPAKDNTVVGLNVDDFHSTTLVTIPPEALVELFTKDHHKMYKILNKRKRGLQMIASRWRRGEITEALREMCACGVDVRVDFLTAAERALRGAFTLELCAIILPTLAELATSKFESHVLLSLRYSKVLLDAFSSLIRSTLEAKNSHKN